MRTIRVVSHVHSDWSYDGTWSLVELARAFRHRGYDAVLMAEHDRGFDSTRWRAYREACAVSSDDEILLVPGIEYSDRSNSVHVPVWGDIPFLGESMDTELLLRRANDVGGFSVLAHPARRQALDRLDPNLLAFFGGLEIWNRKYDGMAPNRRAAQLRQSRPELLPMVSLDFHTARQFYPLGMVLEIEGDASEAAICVALQHRRARPIAFGFGAASFARHPVWAAVHGLERCRKQAARRARKIRRLQAALHPR